MNKPVRSGQSRAVVTVYVVLAILLAPRAHMHAQESSAAARPPATVSFAFERPGVPVPKYILRVAEDGRGTYEGEESAPPSRYPGVSSPAAPISRGFTLSAATTRKIFAFARELHSFTLRCDSKLKNVADTGKKTLTYKGPEGEGTCTYNYSENKSVTQLTEIFQDLAGTMDEGRQLDHLHRYDRLGLDAAINFLAQQVTEGHATELGTIQATLNSIANDTDVIQRVRMRATTLLAAIPVELREP